MQVFVVRPDAFDKLGHRSPSPPFGLRRVNAITRSKRRILPEPESRSGLSLARNGAFATIARSAFPTCAFDSTLQTFANPFHSRLLRSVRFRGRHGAKSSPEARFPRQFAALLQFSPASTPLWVFFKPSGSKRSTGSTTRSPSRETLDCPLPRLKTRCVPLD